MQISFKAFKKYLPPLVLLVVIVLEIGFFAKVFLVLDKTKFLAAVLPGVLESLTNQERAQNDASALTDNALLSKAAQLKANDMATYGYFAHTSPAGKTPWYWFDLVGYKYSYAGENLAVNFFESADVANAWMNSPGHRANIVKKNYTEIGIGVANGVYQGKNTVFVAQLFGAPQKIAEAQAPVKTPVLAEKPAPVPKKLAPKVSVTPLEKSQPNSLAVQTPVPKATEVLGEQTDSTVTAPVLTEGVVYTGLGLASLLLLIVCIHIRAVHIYNRSRLG